MIAPTRPRGFPGWLEQLNLADLGLVFCSHGEGVTFQLLRANQILDQYDRVRLITISLATTTNGLSRPVESDGYAWP